MNNTSANIPYDIVDKITVPFYFYALGVDPGMGVTEKGINKFINWVEYVSKKKNFYLSIRNDGALETLKKHFPTGFYKNFTHLVDGGFLVDTSKIVTKTANPLIKYIGINIAGDMLDIRFNGELTYKNFISKFSDYLCKILEKNENYNIILIPHIFRDYNCIFDILKEVQDSFRRERIDVAGLFQGNVGMLKTINSYNKCSIVLANRFHSNVIGLVLEKTVLGLYNYRQISDLYNELDLDNYYDIRSNIGLNKLFNSLEKCISSNSNNSKHLNKNYIIQNKKNTLNFFEKINL